MLTGTGLGFGICHDDHGCTYLSFETYVILIVQSDARTSMRYVLCHELQYQRFRYLGT